MIPGSRTRCRWVQLLMQPREESVRGCVATVQFSRAVREGVRVDGAREPRRAAPVSQNSTACDALELRGMRRWHVQVWSTFQADRAWLVALSRRRRRSQAREARFRSGSVTELPRKEVIQPQLPLRLPCYDFTPVTGPTFDGFLPKGLDHRLRVLPTPVV